MQEDDRAQPQSLTIMIIDDSASERVQLSAKLKQLGHQVTEHVGGEHALAYLSGSHSAIDLIILDVNMPDINGFDTARKIRQLEELQSEEWCPIIFLSGNPDSEMISEGIKAGGDDYLVKPVDTTVMVAKISAMQRIATMRQRLIAANHQLSVLAHTDELTQLPNRRSFLDVLKSEMARAKRYKSNLSIAYMDLDHFKNINDTYGHETGDIVLQATANILFKNLRSEDSIGRIGGEEFAICLPGANAKNSLEPCERYRILIENLEIVTPSETISVTASFGLTDIDSATDNSSSIMARADEALYQAKQGGRNCIYVK